jgi:hypothetical protein
VWLELEKPDKSITSLSLLLLHVAGLLKRDHQELLSIWSTMSPIMIKNLWKHVSYMINKYGKRVNQKIIMRIDSSPASLFFGRPFDGFFATTLEGFCYKKNQVALIPVMDDMLKMNRMYLPDASYNSDELAHALRDGYPYFHPLAFHRQLRYLPEDAHMKIVIRDQDGFDCRIFFSEKIENRILHYLVHDSLSSFRQCFDFFKEVFFGLANRCRDCKKVSFCHQLELIDNDTVIIPGDGIVLFSKGKANGTQNSIVLKHYAIALGDTMYISKFGNGGKLCVSTMEAMLRVYNCRYCAKVNRAVACVGDFIKTCCSEVIVT